MSKPLKLLIFEENHFEVLDVYMDIMALLKDKVDVHLVTTKEVFNWCQSQKLPTQIFFSDEGLSRQAFLNKTIDYINNNGIEVFLYNTITLGDYVFAGELMQAIKQKTSSKIVLTIHNINALFTPKVFHWDVRVAYQLVKFKSIKQKQIHPNIDAYSVLCSNQLGYLKSINKTTKPVFYMPPCIIQKNEKQQTVSDAKPLVVAIPGGVDKNRRDYTTIIQALKADTSILPNLKIMLLGSFNSSYGQLVYNELKALSVHGLQLWAPENASQPVSGNLFTSKASEANIFLCPTNEETLYEGTKELYGKSKSSGSFYDIVRYKKPAIFPANISLPKEITNCTLSYKNASDLSNIFSQLIRDNSLLDHLNNQVANLHQYFDAETISNHVYEQLSSLV